MEWNKDNLKRKGQFPMKRKIYKKWDSINQQWTVEYVKQYDYSMQVFTFKTPLFCQKENYVGMKNLVLPSYPQVPKYEELDKPKAKAHAGMWLNFRFISELAKAGRYTEKELYI